MDDIFISTAELDDLLNRSGSGEGRPLVILDARPAMNFLFSHIPGAVNVNWKEFSDPQAPIKSLLDSDIGRLEQKVGAVGISMDSAVVVYADPFDCWGDEGRIYWMLVYLGHPFVRVLDGGWIKWKQEGRTVQRGPASAQPATFKARVNREELATKEDIRRLLEEPSDGSVIIDARDPNEYKGLKSSGLPREGHIPGAVNIPWNSFYNPDGTAKSPEEIRSALEGKDVRADREAVTYCTGGVRSAWLYLILKRAGIRQVRNYAGSWMEWSRDPELPIER